MVMPLSRFCVITVTKRKIRTVESWLFSRCIYNRMRINCVAEWYNHPPGSHAPYNAPCIGSTIKRLFFYGTLICQRNSLVGGKSAIAFVPG